MAVNPRLVIEQVSFGLSTPIATDDVCGMVIAVPEAAHAAISGVPALGVPFMLTSTQDAIAQQLDEFEAADSEYNVFRNIEQFYRLAGDGQRLYVILVPDTVSLTNMATSTNTHTNALLNYAEGAITLLGLITQKASGPTSTSGYATDTWNAVGAAQTLVNAQAAQQRFMTVFLSGKVTSADVNVVASMNAKNAKDVAVCVTNEHDGGLGAVGLALGKAVSIDLAQSLGERLSGPLLGVDNQLLTTSDAGYMPLAQLQLWNQKHLLLVSKIQGLNGYYFYDELTCADDNADYNHVSDARVVQKACRIATQVYNARVNQKEVVDANGKLLPAGIEAISQLINKALAQNLVSQNQASSVTVYIDPNQNVLATSRVTVQLRIVPLGKLKEIVVQIGLVKS